MKENVNWHSSVLRLYQFYKTSTDLKLRKKVQGCPQKATPDPVQSQPTGYKRPASETGSVFPLRCTLVW